MTLENLREKANGPILKIILGVIIVFFVFAGYYTSSLFSDDPNAAVIVNGESISSYQVDSAYENAKRYFGENFDSLFVTDEQRAQFRANVVDNLINQKLLQQQVNDAGLRASPEQIRKIIRETPAFQEDGRYSPELAERVLRQQGFTKDSYTRAQSDQLAVSQLVNGLSQTEFALQEEVNRLFQLQQQTRAVRLLKVPSDKYLADVSISEEEVADYYQQNQESFQTQETVTVEFLRVNADSLKAEARAEINDADIETWYANNQDSYGTAEQRKVSHILIRAARDDESELAAAEARIGEIREKLEQGADFGELAGEYSDDTFSAKNQGELDYFGPGAMVPEFEEAAYALEEKGDISEPVSTDFGIHLIKLLDIKAADVKSLDEVRDEIHDTLATIRAEENFYNRREDLAEKSFEMGDLESVAQATGLDLQTSAAFGGNGGTGIAEFPQVVNAAFSPELLEGNISEVIDLGENDAAVIRVAEHKPAAVKPLADVEAEISGLIRSDKARERASALGQELMAELKAGNSIEEQVAELELEWQQDDSLRRSSASLDREVINRAFTMPAPAAEQTVWQGLSLNDGDYALIGLEAVNTPDPDNMEPGQREQLAQTLSRYYANLDYQAFVNALRSDVDIKVKNQ